MTQGYYRYPTLFKDQIVFVSEDDLWLVSLKNPTARRLTAGRGSLTAPRFSPDGRLIAFSGREEGGTEIYVMPADGGELKRLTYFGMEATTQVVAWKDASTLFVVSNARTSQRATELYEVSIDGGLPRPTNMGPVVKMAYQGPDQKTVIERNHNRSDPAHWKRYRGGTAGRFWLADGYEGEYQPILKNLKGNLSSPQWASGRLYFISDHERIGQLYSCDSAGKDVHKHSAHKEFYARNLSGDGEGLVYHSGADLFYFNPKTMSEPKAVTVDYHSQRTERQRRFVSVSKYLEDYNLNPQGDQWAITVRGQVHTFESFSGPTQQLGKKPGVRYKLPVWGMESKKIFVVSDEGGEDRIEVYDAKTIELVSQTEGLDLGRVTELYPNPKNDYQAAVTNHRNELLLVDLSANNYQLVNRNSHRLSEVFDWSPDGLWISYTKTLSQKQSRIELYSVKDEKSYPATAGNGFQQHSPRFDRTEPYLYFLSREELDPVYDTLQFELSFINATLPGVVPLTKNLKAPFEKPVPKKPSKKTSEAASVNANGSEDEPAESQEGQPSGYPIDLEGLSERAICYPVPAGRYGSLYGNKGQIYFLSQPVEGSLQRNIFAKNDEPKLSVVTYDRDKKSLEVYLPKVSQMAMTSSGSHLFVRCGKNLRQVTLGGAKPANKDASQKGPETGWIDLDRVKVLIEPIHEWKQMFDEVWRLQRDHYWVESMSRIDWSRVRSLYRPLLERVGSRREFGDLIWEVQGELGTSHAYDIGGDFKVEPSYRVGMLGADFIFDEKEGAYRIARILKSPSSKLSERSPLTVPGLSLKDGDLLYQVAGQDLSREVTPDQALFNLAKAQVSLVFKRKGSDQKENSTCETLMNESQLRYWDWVERNREWVHEKSGGRIGYVHIPNMGPFGFAEFHRSYFQDYDRDALVIDVRYNGGGHVSQLLLEKLARKRTAMNVSRWFEASEYPSLSPAGPLVALTNEFAGSDGDIFSHNFKLWGLGPLIGTRTWGGVIGISPRHFLADGGITTQPEYSYWFKDVGFDVENYGTDPDIEIDISPQEWRQGVDPQLQKALDVALERLEKEPPYRPEVKVFPDLSR